MIDSLRRTFPANRVWTWATIGSVLLGAAVLGSRASTRWLILLGASITAIALLRWPLLGLLALVPAALVIPMEFGTGTEVALNLATLLVPALLCLWVVDMARKHKLQLVPSRTIRPLFLFVLTGLLSLLVGNALWDPAVPRSGSFTLVQLAQWAIFVFSAGAFLLTGNLIRERIWLQRLTLFFLVVAGGVAIFFVLAGDVRLVKNQLVTVALIRSPFWMLLTALAGGQLLFNKELSATWRLFMVAILGAILVFAFYLERETASHWIGVVTVIGVLIWMRWESMRWVALQLTVVKCTTGLCGPETRWKAGHDVWGVAAAWVF